MISPHYFQRNWLVKSPQKAGQSCAENSVFWSFDGRFEPARVSLIAALLDTKPRKLMGSLYPSTFPVLLKLLEDLQINLILFGEQ